MTSLVEAIHNKFQDVNSDVKTEFVIVAPKVDIQNGIPHVLVISARSVDKAGNPEELQKLLAQVVELDISHNDMRSLDELALVFQSAPKLQFLNFGFNNLSGIVLPTIPKEFPRIDTLKTLILIGTEAPWTVIWFFLDHAKNISELHLSRNNYTQVDLADQAHDHDQENASLDKSGSQFGQVVKLMFDNNPISSWNEISKLGIAFPNLNHLSLTESPLDSITANGEENFKVLKILWISNCRISKLEDLQNLKHFPALNDLRINGIPYLQDLNEETRRQHFIAILPNIVTLNRGRTINDEERIAAERNFIRYYMDHSDPPERYHELKRIHGEVPKLVELSMKPPTKAHVSIFFEDKKICQVDVQLKKTVKELKDFLEPLVGLAATNMDLFYLEPIDTNCGKEIMKYPSRKLYTYHMNDNSEIYVHRKGTVVCGSTVIR